MPRFAICRSGMQSAVCVVRHLVVEILQRLRSVHAVFNDQSFLALCERRRKRHLRVYQAPICDRTSHNRPIGELRHIGFIFASAA